MPINLSNVLNDPYGSDKMANAIQALNDAQTDKNIDKITKREITQGLSEFYNKNWEGKGAGVFTGDSLNARGSLLSSLYNMLEAARAGTGVYGVRKINENQRNMIAAQPGRQALIAAKFGGSGSKQSGTPTGGQAANLGGSNEDLGSFF